MTQDPGQPDRPQMSAGEATLLVHRLQSGDSSAAEELLPLVYEQLRATAGSFFREQRSDHTLQPTALVHEAYLKLVQSPSAEWDGRAHFCAVAAKAMRQILHDHARAKRAAKRGGEGQKVPMTAIKSPSSHAEIDLIALDDALAELGEVDARGSRIVELRFFGGLTNEQVATVTGESLRTVERSWRGCRAWLRTQLDTEAVEHDT